LRRLLVLFPGDSALEKDRTSLANGRPKDPRPEPARLPDAAADSKGRPLPELSLPVVQSGSRIFSRPRVAVVSGALLLAAGGAALLRPPRGSVSASGQAAIPVKQEIPRPPEAGPPTLPVTLPPERAPQAEAPRKPAEPARIKSVSRPKVEEAAEPSPRRTFRVPVQPAAGGAQTVDLPAPPSTAAVGFTRETASLSAVGPGLTSLPAPAPPISPQVPRGVTQPARLIGGLAPVFPSAAKQNHVSGTVEIEATIDPQGRVAQASILRGNPLLNGAARQAGVQGRYQPALIDGRPVEAKIDIKVDFQESKSANR